MKKINTLLICVTIFLCGCNKSNTDSAKIEALSQKLDVVLKNQADTTAKLEALPDTINYLVCYYNSNTLNMMHYCYTNTSNLLPVLALQEQDIENGVNAETRRVGVIAFTNMMSDNYSLLGQLQEISTRTAVMEFSLTNWPPVSSSDKDFKEMESEVWATKDEIHEMDHDLIKIKVQLGIPN